MFRYKEFRRAHGLFQSQLAEIMGMVQSNVSRYETEGIEPTPEQYQKLYEKYGKEDVDSYIVKGEALNSNVNIHGNQNNGVQVDKDIIEIIKKQTEILANHIVEQDKINSRLISVLENLSIK
ncbi:helix-turn-helix transcriptional regulator [Hallella sp.]|uniref:helix-turn-helix domain-containing protein n=1 Tax=Hallella sp. TaxID=2980186 RepID=UPI0030799C5A